LLSTMMRSDPGAHPYGDIASCDAGPDGKPCPLREISTSPARLNAGSKNQKQALGFYAANYLVRMDMDVNLLQTPQIPIVEDPHARLSEYEKHPSGQNVVVAVMSYNGYNMEDAIIFNKASHREGLWQVIIFQACCL
jgi:DNA-directed RNA polymerase beta subunit